MDRRELLEATALSALVTTGVGSVRASELVDRTDREQSGWSDQSRAASMDETATEIETAEELQAIADDPAGTYALAADVDASSTAEWNDGAGFEPIDGFTGTLEGNGHEITGLVADRPDEDRVGLFGELTGTVRNLVLSDIEVTGNDDVGALAGSASGATVTGVSVSGRVDGGNAVGGVAGGFHGGDDEEGFTLSVVESSCTVTGTEKVGCLVGSSFGSMYTDAERLEGCVATGEVAGTLNVGGLVGEANGVVVTNCTSSASVSQRETEGRYYGGLVGYLHKSQVGHSAATGPVKAPDGDNVGGLVGEIRDPGGKVVASSATGAVVGHVSVGGLVGSAIYGPVKRSYATGDVDGQKIVGGLVGVVRDEVVSDVYAHGKVTSKQPVGGVVGVLENAFGGGAAVERAVATGRVDPVAEKGVDSIDEYGFWVGAIVGKWKQPEDGGAYPSIKNSFWDRSTTGMELARGKAESGKFPSCAGVTTGKLQGETAAETLTPFDFESVWRTRQSQYPTLRNVGPRTDGGGEVTCLDTSTIQFDPYPVVTGERPALSVAVEDAESVTLTATYRHDGETIREVQRSLDPGGRASGGGRVWETADPLPACDVVGAWVEVTLEVVTDDGTCTVEKLDNSFLDESRRIGYYVFDQRTDVLVLPARFEGEEVDTDPERVERWRRGRELDLNRYWGSGRGSMGAVGFSVTVSQDGDDFYTVGERDDYGPGGLLSGEDSGKENFLFNLAAVATGSGDVDISAYDVWIGTHTGKPIGNKAGGVAFPNRSIYAARFRDDAEEAAIWNHELGHTYGLTHTYDRGLPLQTNLGAMNNGYRAGDGLPGKVPSVSPMTTPLRLAKTLGLTTPGRFGRNDDLQDWLAPRQVSRVDADDFEAEIPALQALTFRETVPYVGDPETVAFVVESRPYLRLTSDRADPDPGTEWHPNAGAAVVYRLGGPTLFQGSVTVLGEFGEGQGWGIFSDPGERVSEKLLVASPVEIAFELEHIANETAPPAEFSTTVSASLESGRAETKTVAAAGRVELPNGFDTYAGSSDGHVQLPSLSLRARNTEGRLVGLKDGEYRTEIPDATASGNRGPGTEWISVPHEADVTFEVSSADVERFIEELKDRGELVTTEEDGDARLTEQEFREQTTVTVDVSKTIYGADPEVVTDGDRPWVEGATVRADRRTIGIGETATAVPTNPDGDIELLAVAADASLAEEHVTFRNPTDSPLEVSEWRLSNAAGATFEFSPGTTIPAGGELDVYTGSGKDGGGDVYWGRTDPVWNDSGGRVTLTDRADRTRLSAAYDGVGAVYYDPAMRSDYEPIGRDVSDDVSSGLLGLNGLALPSALAGGAAAAAGLVHGGYQLLAGDDSTANEE